MQSAVAACLNGSDPVPVSVSVSAAANPEQSVGDNNTNANSITQTAAAEAPSALQENTTNSNSIKKKEEESSEIVPRACRECVILRREVNDIRTKLEQINNNFYYQMILQQSQNGTPNNGLRIGATNPALPTSLSIANSVANPAALIQQLAAQQANATLNQQTVTQSAAAAGRKRPAPPNSQPEHPVAVRPAITPSLPSNIIYPWLMNSVPMRQLTSPTAPSSTEAQPSSTEPVEVASGKWSNPSSVESNGHKTDSSIVSAAESGNIDIVGIDGSESSTSSTSTQAMITSPTMHQHLAQQLLNAVTKANSILPSTQTLYQDNHIMALKPTPILGIPTQQIVSEPRKHRKPVNDDIVKVIRSHDLSPAAIAKIQIPVQMAIETDPAFRPVSEQQIIQQVVQGKKYEEMNVGESMISLCKKLAEKRVFGPRLMANTTVAGLNHSNYSNLPIEGICYIQHVCRQVLGDKIPTEEEFWEKFRDAMRKLAARCRRVRHAKKSKSQRENGLIKSDEWPEAASMSQTIHTLGLAPPPTISQPRLAGLSALVKDESMQEQKSEQLERPQPTQPQINLQQIAEIISQFSNSNNRQINGDDVKLSLTSRSNIDAALLMGLSQSAASSENQPRAS